MHADVWYDLQQRAKAARRAGWLIVALVALVIVTCSAWRQGGKRVEGRAEKAVNAAAAKVAYWQGITARRTFEAESSASVNEAAIEDLVRETDALRDRIAITPRRVKLAVVPKDSVADTTRVPVWLEKPFGIVVWTNASDSSVTAADSIPIRVANYITIADSMLRHADQLVGRWVVAGQTWRLERESWRSALAASDSGRHAMKSQLALTEQAYEKRLESERCRWFRVIDCPSRTQTLVTGLVLGATGAAFVLAR